MKNRVLHTLLIVIIILQIVIIRQNKATFTQINSNSNYLSEKIDFLSSYVRMLNQ